MRKALLVVIGLFLFTSLAYAGQETIKDDNDGNKGDIFVNTGTQQGNNDIGHWTDITTIPELKGEQGIAGFDGLNGINGLDGQNGLDGYTPIKGVDYFDGIDGINGEDGLNGEKGDTGEQGIQGFTGEQGIQGIQGIQGLIGNTGNTGEQGIQGVQGKTGVKGDKGDKGDRGLRGKGLKDQYKAGVGLRIFDTKRTQGEIAYYRDFNNQANEIVAKITIKLGSSYEEREIAKTNSRLDRLEKQIGNSPIITKVVENGKTKSISISANGLAVSGDF
jgi:hypothetical protein